MNLCLDPFRQYAKLSQANDALPSLHADVPSHCFQYTFANNPDWSHFFAPGAEIGDYFRIVAEKYNVKKYVKFGHVFKSAKWLEDEAQWEITILRAGDNLVCC